MVLQNYQHVIEMTSNMIYIVALGGDFKCPCKIHLNTQCPGLLSSRVMSIFAVSSHKYTITLHTPENLEIIWELFAKKSADILSFCNSFITMYL